MYDKKEKRQWMIEQAFDAVRQGNLDKLKVFLHYSLCFGDMKKLLSEARALYNEIQGIRQSYLLCDSIADTIQQTIREYHLTILQKKEGEKYVTPGEIKKWVEEHDPKYYFLLYETEQSYQLFYGMNSQGGIVYCDIKEMEPKVYQTIAEKIRNYVRKKKKVQAKIDLERVIISYFGYQQNEHAPSVQDFSDLNDNIKKIEEMHTDSWFNPVLRAGETLNKIDFSNLSMMDANSFLHGRGLNARGFLLYFSGSPMSQAENEKQFKRTVLNDKSEYYEVGIIKAIHVAHGIRDNLRKKVKEGGEEFRSGAFEEKLRHFEDLIQKVKQQKEIINEVREGIIKDVFEREVDKMDEDEFSEFIEILLSVDLPLDIIDGNGDTFLHVALRELDIDTTSKNTDGEKWEIIKLLLEGFSEFTECFYIRNKKGESVLDVATSRKGAILIEQLLKYGFNINLLTPYSVTIKASAENGDLFVPSCDIAKWAKEEDLSKSFLLYKKNMRWQIGSDSSEGPCVLSNESVWHVYGKNDSGNLVDCNISEIAKTVDVESHKKAAKILSKEGMTYSEKTKLLEIVTIFLGHMKKDSEAENKWVDVNNQWIDEEGNTLLHRAMFYGCYELAAYLIIEHNIDLRKPNENELTFWSLFDAALEQRDEEYQISLMLPQKNDTYISREELDEWAKGKDLQKNILLYKNADGWCFLGKDSHDKKYNRGIEYYNPKNDYYLKKIYELLPKQGNLLTKHNARQLRKAVRAYLGYPLDDLDKISNLLISMCYESACTREMSDYLKALSCIITQQRRKLLRHEKHNRLIQWLLRTNEQLIETCLVTNEEVLKTIAESIVTRNDIEAFRQVKKILQLLKSKSKIPEALAARRYQPVKTLVKYNESAVSRVGFSETIFNDSTEEREIVDFGTREGKEQVERFKREAEEEKAKKTSLESEVKLLESQKEARLKELAEAKKRIKELEKPSELENSDKKERSNDSMENQRDNSNSRSPSFWSSNTVSGQNMSQHFSLRKSM